MIKQLALTEWAIYPRFYVHRFLRSLRHEQTQSLPLYKYGHRLSEYYVLLSLDELSKMIKC